MKVSDALRVDVSGRQADKGGSVGPGEGDMRLRQGDKLAAVGKDAALHRPLMVCQ